MSNWYTYQYHPSEASLETALNDFKQFSTAKVFIKEPHPSVLGAAYVIFHFTDVISESDVNTLLKKNEIVQIPSQIQDQIKKDIQEITQNPQLVELLNALVTNTMHDIRDITIKDVIG